MSENLDINGIDVRFTMKENKLYALLLEKPVKKNITIRDLNIPGIAEICLSGTYEKLEFLQNRGNLTIVMPEKMTETPVVAIRIVLKEK